MGRSSCSKFTFYTLWPDPARCYQGFGEGAVCISPDGKLLYDEHTLKHFQQVACEPKVREDGTTRAFPEVRNFLRRKFRIQRVTAERADDGTGYKNFVFVQKLRSLHLR